MSRWYRPALALALATACLLALSPAALAEDRGSAEAVAALDHPETEGAEVTLFLAGGEIVRGRLVRVEGGEAVIDHALLGELRVPLTDVEGADGVPAAALPAPEPVDPNAWTWDNRFEFGFLGSTGNTERFKIGAVFAINGRSEVARLTFRSALDYETSNGTKNASRWDNLLRHDWLLPDSDWSIFAQVTVTFDEFQAWNWRAAGHAGFGYIFVDDETLDIVGRIGAGASKEFGGDNIEKIRPEALLGLDIIWQINDRQRFVATGELYPLLDELGEFRSVARAQWEIDLDDDGTFRLALGAEHRYQTEARSASRTDLDYFARIVIGF